MVADRLEELRRKGSITDLDDTIIEIEFGRQGEDENLNRFLGEVGSIRNLIDELAVKVEHVERLHRDILLTLVPDKRQKTELDELTTIISQSSQMVQMKLKALEKLSAIDGQILGPASQRVRKTQLLILIKLFGDLMISYKFEQAKYKDECEKRIRGQWDNVSHSSSSDADLDEMLKKGSLTAFTKQLMVETDTSEEMRRTLRDVEARHSDIIQTEMAIQELNYLFRDLSILVDLQGVTIESISQQVEGAVEWVDEGQKELKQAKKLQKKARKKKLYMLVCAVVGGLAVGLFSYVF